MQVEFASNLVWAVFALALLGMTYGAVRRGKIRLSMVAAMTLALLVCFILLPVISISDDLLANTQAALPLSGQSWRIASEDSSIGLDLLLAVAAFLLLLACFQTEFRRSREDLWDIRPLAGWLARSLRLRPPPCVA